MNRDELAAQLLASMLTGLWRVDIDGGKVWRDLAVKNAADCADALIAELARTAPQKAASVEDPRGHRNHETRAIEDALCLLGFSGVEAYLHDPSTIRVMISDPLFNGLSEAAQADEVTRHLKKLPKEILEFSMISIFACRPVKVLFPEGFTREMAMNHEFENPSPSEI